MNAMKQLCCPAIALATCAALAPMVALANEPLQKDSQDPNQWVLPLGNYSEIGRAHV